MTSIPPTRFTAISQATDLEARELDFAVQLMERIEDGRRRRLIDYLCARYLVFNGATLEPTPSPALLPPCLCGHASNDHDPSTPPCRCLAERCYCDDYRPSGPLPIPPRLT